jgi:hypothetical protein
MCSVDIAWHCQGCLLVNYENRKTELSVPGFGDYMLLKKDRRRASKP